MDDYNVILQIFHDEFLNIFNILIVKSPQVIILSSYWSDNISQYDVFDKVCLMTCPIEVVIKAKVNLVSM